MLKEIKNKIKKYRIVRYQKILLSKKDIKLRKIAIQHICKTIKNTKNPNKKNCVSCKFYSKHLKKVNFISFYKKFNSRLQLKEKYNLKTLNKLSNKNACFKSYLKFSEILMNSRQINNIQKLNTIFKINDLLILKYSKKKHKNLIYSFIKNINYERKLIKKYL